MQLRTVAKVPPQSCDNTHRATKKRPATQRVTGRHVQVQPTERTNRSPSLLFLFDSLLRGGFLFHSGFLHCFLFSAGLLCSRLLPGGVLAFVSKDLIVVCPEFRRCAGTDDGSTHTETLRGRRVLLTLLRNGRLMPRRLAEDTTDPDGF
jgi:hypothetical protein